MSQDLDSRLAAARIVPVLTVPRAAMAEPLAETLAAAGIVCAEVTFRTEASAQVLAKMAAHGALCLGAGTVLNPRQAEQAVDAGAAFIVSPGLDLETLERSRVLGTPIVPGVATASELMAALRIGVHTVKLFPAAQIGGLALLNALAAPFPQARFMPTGGITPENAAGYLAHPAVLAVGGSWIAPRELLENGDYREIGRRAALAVSQGQS